MEPQQLSEAFFHSLRAYYVLNVPHTSTVCDVKNALEERLKREFQNQFRADSEVKVESKWTGREYEGRDLIFYVKRESGDWICAVLEFDRGNENRFFVPDSQRYMNARDHVCNLISASGLAYPDFPDK
jgi:hypothetical protein